MTTIENIRKQNKELALQRKENVKTILEEHFENTYINKPRAFRAIVGNKRCRPIPIHRSLIWTTTDGKETTFHYHKYEVENISEELIRKELEELGFVLTKDKIRLMVPPCEKGKKLTFAQELVKKINKNYSLYCKAEYEKAEKLYSFEVLEALRLASLKNVKTCNGYTIYYMEKFETPISRPCYRRIKQLMLRDGIEEYFEEGKYKGLKVIDKATDN